MMSESTRKGDQSAARLNGAARVTQRVIGQRLREMYDSVVGEEVPDDFALLLKKLDESEKGTGDGGA